MNVVICGDFATTARGFLAVKNGKALDSEIVEKLRSADLSIVNLEAPVCEDESTGIKKVGPHLKTTAETLRYLKKIGVNVVTLANNHFFDYGETAVTATIKECVQNEMLYVGGGRNCEEYSKILYIESKRSTIAILNYCEAEFSVNRNIGSNHVNSIQVFYDINNAKEKADFILIITHGGHEGYNLPSPRMQELYQYMIDAGANIVVNHHQHCFSGMEEYHGGQIFYGLGNFFFDYSNNPRKKPNGWNFGYMVELNIEKSELKNFNLIPYVQCDDADICVKLADRVKFEKEMLELNVIIADSEKIKEYFMEYAKSQKRNLLAWFSPYTNRYLLALYRRHLLPSWLTKKKRLQILNAIRCESHRDLCIMALNDDK